jgi:peptidyl-prolyl cis-trans isomerase D
LPDAIAADQPVDEAALKALYDERIDEFVVPERRLVERLVFPDQAAADAAKARLDAGRPVRDLVIERGLTLDAIDLGDVSQADLGAAGEAVFAATEGSTVAADSDLGPALYRVNGILAGEETTFDQARDLLASEMQTDAARRADRRQGRRDRRPSGRRDATLKDLAKEAGMTFATVDHVPGQQGAAPSRAIPPSARPPLP